MLISYGSYQFPDGGVTYSISRTLQELRPGIPYSSNVRVDMQFNLEGATPNALAAAEVALERAVAAPYFDLIIRYDGAVLEGIRSVGSLSGVRCIEGPNYLGDTPGDFTTYRKVALTFAAEYPAKGMPEVLEYQQTVAFEGGNPVYVWQLAINGPPKKVKTCPQTPYTATQSGTAVGLKTWPTPPKPIFGVADRASRTQTSPTRQGMSVTGFAITWDYQFSSVSPFIGNAGMPP